MESYVTQYCHKYRWFLNIDEDALNPTISSYIWIFWSLSQFHWFNMGDRVSLQNSDDYRQ